MPDYKNMYKNLFNAVTEAIEILQQAQIDAEEMYIDSSEIDETKLTKFKILDNAPEEKQ